MPQTYFCTKGAFFFLWGRNFITGDPPALRTSLWTKCSLIITVLFLNTIPELLYFSHKTKTYGRTFWWLLLSCEGCCDWVWGLWAKNQELPGPEENDPLSGARRWAVCLLAPLCPITCGALQRGVAARSGMLQDRPAKRGLFMGGCTTGGCRREHEEDGGSHVSAHRGRCEGGTRSISATDGGGGLRRHQEEDWPSLGWVTLKRV